MTNKEAAEFIWDVLDGVKSFNEKGGKGLEALDLAIKALKNENAPTVEERPQVTVFCENADEKAIADMKEELQKVIDDSRPQGKWIKKQVTPASCTYVCSECGIEEVILGNFCRWCGAKMQKGGEK